MEEAGKGKMQTPLGQPMSTLRIRETTTTTLSTRRDKIRNSEYRHSSERQKGDHSTRCYKSTLGGEDRDHANPTVMKIDNDKVDKASFCRLNDGLWLDDSIIDFFL